MSPLYDSLFLYAMEHRVRRFQQPYCAKESDVCRKAEQAMELLRTRDSQTAAQAQQLESAMNTLTSICEERAFLAGLSIGLELGTLLQGT